MNISFCGCGFLGIYHIGVVKALLCHAPKVVSQFEKVGGASAGALAGAILLCEPGKIDECKQFNIELADTVRKKPLGALTPNFNILDPVKEFIKGSIPDDGYKKADGVLHISLTTFNGIRWPANKIVSKYSSNEELTDCLIASCYIPVYVGVNFPVIQNKTYTDGGFTNNLLEFEEGRTISVSPFCGGQDIAPIDPDGMGLHIRVKNQTFRFNQWNGTRGFHAMFPPTRDTLLKYYEAGYTHTEAFLKKEGCIENSQS